MTSLITEQDLYLFNEGTHFRLYEKLGAHLSSEDGVEGAWFAVWAPDAAQVSVIGDWNLWNKRTDLMTVRGSSGLWEAFIPGVTRGMKYKYHVISRYNGYRVDKADPFAFYAETPPLRASIVWDLDYAWQDDDWMASRQDRQSVAAPMSIYELHLGSWRRVIGEGNRSLTYREAAPLLAEHIQRLGFTHVELMPIMEHPFYGSWGYQSTGYFAPTSRHGTPQDFMFLVDFLHQQGIGVILDWVPSHFPGDEHALAFFDGTHLYEHADPRKGFHPDWSSYIFNYGRNEVRSFLASSAVFWLERYHGDGLRVDAVASMLYLDYSRKEEEWIPNLHGGRENLESISFLRALNDEIAEVAPTAITIAEESTAWPLVSRPTYVGGLGFDFKWDMGWMHDTLDYLSQDPLYRRYHHNEITFRMVYAFSENFVLPLSHDEVVHGKGSLVNKMPGDVWQKLANLRLLYGAMWSQPGKKLLFMGGELAQWREWNHDSSLDWHLLEDERHAGIMRWLEDLNRLYQSEPALHELDCDPAGFEWIDGSDAENSVIAYLRKAKSPVEPIVVVFSFTPVPRDGYRIGVPGRGFWREILNSDAAEYGGSGVGNLGGVEAEAMPKHGRTHSVSLTLPPLGVLFLQREAGAEDEEDLKDSKDTKDEEEEPEEEEIEPV
ncbi:MAG: 1,4-alpha-glucan branching enzyme [Acidobacteriota bacterium]|jgi:1,4-alpha-glucan branching enzyme|nr:1,4-alpha-glucan branching enzyme [Acidobacteriota bacterium]